MSSKNSEQGRKPAKEGYNLVTTLDINLQQYAEQTLEKAVIGKKCKKRFCNNDESTKWGNIGYGL